MDDGNGRWRNALLVGGLGLIIAGGLVDLYFDATENGLSSHVVFDLLIVIGAMAIIIAFWTRWRGAEADAAELRLSLEERRAACDAWRASAQRALAGLSEEIDRQFGAWGLTGSEKEVAFLVLKGYSHKRIAKETGRSEHTVRQHAGAAYQKAGLAGRAELAAFFLEGLILPSSDAEPERRTLP